MKGIARAPLPPPDREGAAPGTSRLFQIEVLRTLLLHALTCTARSPTSREETTKKMRLHSMVDSPPVAEDPAAELATELHNTSLADTQRPLPTLDLGQALAVARRGCMQRVAAGTCAAGTRRRAARQDDDPRGVTGHWPSLGGAAVPIARVPGGNVWGGREMTLAALCTDGLKAMAVDARRSAATIPRVGGDRATAFCERRGKGPCQPRAKRAADAAAELHGAISKGTPRRDKRSRSVAQQRQVQRQHLKRVARAASEWERHLERGMIGSCTL